MSHDNWKEVAADLQLTVDEQRDEIKKLEHEIAMLKISRDNFKLDAKYMKEKLDDKGWTVKPICVDEGEYECPNCSNEIHGTREDTFCSGCGLCIDWDDIRYSDEPNWYAEEGERYLYNEVYKPLVERMNQ